MSRQKTERTSLQNGRSTVQNSSTVLSVTTASAGISHSSLCSLSLCDFPERIRGSGSEMSRAVGTEVCVEATNRCMRCALAFPAALARRRHSDMSGCQSSSREGSHSSQIEASRPVGASCVPIRRSSHHTPAFASFQDESEQECLQQRQQHSAVSSCTNDKHTRLATSRGSEHVQRDANSSRSLRCVVERVALCPKNRHLHWPQPVR